MRLRPATPLMAFLVLFLSFAARADDPPEIAVSFLGDRFEPAEIAVPVDVKFTLRIDNKATSAMEWESPTLHREKVVPAGGSARLFIGPLRAGSYEYFDDFHPTLRGHVVAR